MIKYEDYRNDKNFKLDSLSYEQIFNGFRDALCEVVKEIEAKECKESTIYLRKERCTFSIAYGGDKDMYPKIQLDIGASYILVLTPFEVKLLVGGSEITEVKSEKLDKTLVKFMCENFPNSDYMEKREKYFKNAELIQRKQEEMLYL